MTSNQWQGGISQLLLDQCGDARHQQLATTSLKNWTPKSKHYSCFDLKSDFSFASMKSVKILVKKWLRNVRVIRWPDSIRNLYLWRTNQFVSLTIRTHRYNWRSNALKKANTSMTTVSLRVKPTKIMKACKIK